MSARSPVVFDEERAALYEKRFAKLAPMKDTLHLVARFALSDLPGGARVLCVGAGTGMELIYLAQVFEGWHFTALDPAAPMLDIARKRAEEAGIAARCTFHTGTLETLPASEPFDAATSILVSHFLTDLPERRTFFESIGARLKPGAKLVTADLAGDLSEPPGQELKALWIESMRYVGMNEEEIQTYLDNLGPGVSVLGAAEVEALLEAAGFVTPTRIFQSALMHGWLCRWRAADA